MNNKEAIEILSDLKKLHCADNLFIDMNDVFALDLAIKALKIVDIPHIRDYIIINTQKIYLTQGHIDALWEYDRKQALEQAVKNFMKSLEEM